MEFTTKTLPAFHLIGIAVRTTNAGGQSAADIGQLWQRFYHEGILDKIPAKTSSDIYCVYTDYESDAAGAYTTILGCAVASLDAAPDGFTGLTIPAATYRVFTSLNSRPETVLATWQHIWQLPVARRYSADFDVYNTVAGDVKTYLAVG